VVEDLLTARELRAARRFVRRVRREVPASLVQASLFGSKAREEAGPDSDVDVLLVFSRLPPDREPHATIAERVAEEVARGTGVPVATWSVALVDLEAGRRTPMLVDALEDGAPIWWARRPLPRLGFTLPDARHCVRALLERVHEGRAEVREHLERGDREEAARRARDDLVRMCTAGLLLRGITRPRRGEAVTSFTRLVLRDEPPPEAVRRVLRWAAGSYGASGKEDEAPVRAPPGGLEAALGVVEGLRRGVLRGLARLERRLDATEPGGARSIR
jgi:predicted nucleotidyltransferase